MCRFQDAATLSVWEAGVLLLISFSSSALSLQSKKESKMLLSPKSYLCLTASALAGARAHQIVTHLTVTTDTASDGWSPGHSTCCCLTEPDRMANGVSPRFSFQSFWRRDDDCVLPVGKLMLKWQVTYGTAVKSLGAPSPSNMVLSLLSMYPLSEGRKSKSPWVPFVHLHQMILYISFAQ